jgi:putative autoinducer-2 (AI-2) aldolase
VIIAGGKKISEMEALQLTDNAVRHGAVGVDMGRNIFQSDSPVGMIRAVRSIVHEKASVDEAYKIYESSKGTKTRKVTSSS